MGDSMKFSVTKQDREEIKKIVVEVAGDMIKKRVSNLVDRHREGLNRVLKDHRIREMNKSVKRDFDKTDRETMILLQKRGFSIQQIGKLYGCSESSISKCIEQRNDVRA